MVFFFCIVRQLIVGPMRKHGFFLLLKKESLNSGFFLEVETGLNIGFWVKIKKEKKKNLNPFSFPN
jgi:hypothetical protein